MVTVPSSTRMPTASARPPSVMTLMVSPSHDSAVSENRIASGISMRMMTVERQLPRNSRIMSADQSGGQHRLADDAEHRGFDENRLIADGMEVAGSPASVCSTRGSSDLMPSMMLSVEADPALRMVISTARAPLTRTRLVCGGEPWCT